MIRLQTLLAACALAFSGMLALQPAEAAHDPRFQRAEAQIDPTLSPWYLIEEDEVLDQEHSEPLKGTIGIRCETPDGRVLDRQPSPLSEDYEWWMECQSDAELLEYHRQYDSHQGQ